MDEEPSVGWEVLDITISDIETEVVESPGVGSGGDEVGTFGAAED